MTKDEQRQFMAELIFNVGANLIADLPKIPAEWDGHELRKLIADRFARCVMGSYMTDKRSKRYRDYKHEVIVRNL